MTDRANELAEIEAAIVAGKMRRYEMADPLDAEINRLLRGEGGKRHLGGRMRESIARHAKPGRSGMPKRIQRRRTKG